MESGQPRSGRHRRSRFVPLAVLVLVAAVALGAFLSTRRTVQDQEDRLLAQRASEVVALLSNSIEGIEASLRVLGVIGSSTDPAAEGLFVTSATPLLTVSTVSVGVAVERGGSFTVVAAVGDGPEPGQALTGDRAALAARARGEELLVSAMVVEPTGTRLVFALASGDAAVAYQESRVDPGRPTPSSPGSPFRELRVALYASPDADPARLLLHTEGALPLPRQAELAPFPVGADRWLLAVAAREPLAGSLAHNLPWFILGGGLFTALLAATVAWVLVRRREYAMALVETRTRELRAAHDDLTETRTFLERLLTAGPVVVRRATLDAERFTYVSPNIERLFGFTQDEVLAPGFPERHIHPDDLPAFRIAAARVATATSPQEVLEYRLRDASGEFHWCSATLVPETDDAGEPGAILSYIVDVDDRRRAQEAQREAQEAAEAANRAKTDFLSRMSHELRTPLNAVLGFGQLLELESLTAAQRESVGHILKGGRHLLDLINEVLDISRVEAGQLALSPEPVLVSDAVSEAVDLIRSLATERGITVVTDRSGACDCYAFADRQRVKQVLLNLLSNAVKYNRPRGTVAVSCAQPSDTRLRIGVADTGPGIPAERMGLLFTPFERLGAEHTAEEGIGIGLSLSKRLAEAMGGALLVESELGRGSTFSVELPRVEGPVERYERLDRGHTTASLPALARRTVLHIEDNLSNLKLVERVLAQRPDVHVVAAMQGGLGLELAHEHRPALILLDLHLPDMSGEQVLQRLREDVVTATIPVVMVSADVTPGHVQRLLSAGATAYLTKPIDVPELLRLLDELLAA